MNPVIRAITEQDYIEIMNEKPQYTLRGFACEHEGRVLGIAGVIHGRPLTAFSKLRPEIKKYKRVIVHAVKEYRKLLSTYSAYVFAMPDESEESAERFLSHVGFYKLNEGMYVWRR